MLSPLGPVVALGKPGQLLTPFGTHKEYLPEDQWHDKVEAYIRSSRATVACLSQTAGFEWELGRIFLSRNEVRTLFIIAPKDHGTNNTLCRLHALSEVAKKYGSIAESSISELISFNNVKKIVAFFYDYENDVVVAITSDTVDVNSYAIAINAFNYRGELEKI